MSVRAQDPSRTDPAFDVGGSGQHADPRSAAALALLAVVFVIESLLFLWLGRALIDEGVFLSAGRRVAEGGVLYRDFPWSQGPTLPHLLAVLSAVFGTSILAGRILAWIGCLTSVGASAWIASRFAGRGGAALALGLAMTNVPALWVSTSVRTQALSTPLVLLAAAALVRTPKGVLGFAAAPSLLLWASGVRVTDALAFAGVTLWTAWVLRDRLGMLARVAAVVGAQALLVLLPVLRSPGEAWFHVITSQLTRGTRGGDPPMALLEKLTFYLHPVYGFRVVAALALVFALVVAVQLGWRRGAGAQVGAPEPVVAQATLLGLAFLVFVPHLALSHVFLTYAVTPSLLVLTALAIALASWAGTPGRSRLAPALAILGVGLAVSFNAAGRAPVFLGGGDSGLDHLRSVGRTLRGLGGHDCEMVTLQTHLAVAAGCRPLEGLEYSQFSFFRDLGDAEARARGVLNPDLLDRRIAESRPELVVLSREDGLRLRARGRPPTGAHPLLEFMPSTALDYAHYGEMQIPSGVRLPGMSDTLRVVVFVRKDRVRGHGGAR